MALTFDEIKTQVDFNMLKQLAKGLNVFPSQLFNFDEIKKDREFTGHFEEFDKTVKELTDYKVKTNDYEKKINDFSRKEQMQTAKQRASAIITNMKLTDKPKTFIEKSLEKEIEKMTDITDASLEKFAKDKWELYREIVQSDTSSTGANIPSGDTSKEKGHIDPDDMSKKANNPLLDDDL
jgi:hypothetical protein